MAWPVWLVVAGLACFLFGLLIKWSNEERARREQLAREAKKKAQYEREFQVELEKAERFSRSPMEIDADAALNWQRILEQDWNRVQQEVAKKYEDPEKIAYFKTKKNYQKIFDYWEEPLREFRAAQAYRRAYLARGGEKWEELERERWGYLTLRKREELTRELTEPKKEELRAGPSSHDVVEGTGSQVPLELVHEVEKMLEKCDMEARDPRAVIDRFFSLALEFLKSVRTGEWTPEPLLSMDEESKARFLKNVRDFAAEKLNIRDDAFFLSYAPDWLWAMIEEEMAQKGVLRIPVPKEWVERMSEADREQFSQYFNAARQRVLEEYEQFLRELLFQSRKGE